MLSLCLPEDTGLTIPGYRDYSSLNRCGFLQVVGDVQRMGQFFTMNV